MIKIFLVFLLSACSSVAYRLGGAGADGNVLGIRGNRYYRRLGVPAIVLITLLFLQPTLPWWVYLSVFVLQFGSLSTYFKWGGQEDVLWYNWLITGVFCGLAALPVAISTGGYWVFLFRSFIISGVYVWVSECSSNVWVEELTRGVVLVATIPLLFLA